jgi:hypothetical protein
MGQLRGDGRSGRRGAGPRGRLRTYAHESRDRGAPPHRSRHARPGRIGRGGGDAVRRKAGSARRTESWLSGADGRPGHDWEDRYLAQRSPPAVGGVRTRALDGPQTWIIVHPERRGRALGRPARSGRPVDGSGDGLRPCGGVSCEPKRSDDSDPVNVHGWRAVRPIVAERSASASTHRLVMAFSSRP